MPPDLYAQPHAAAFLRDVIEHPDDDAPRLIFADWLDDQGDADRAEFIRSQIERESLPQDCPRALELLAHERQLLKLHQKAWLGRLGELTQERRGRPRFRRGFVEVASVWYRQLLDHAEEVFSLAPIRSLEIPNLHDPKAPLSAVGAVPHLQRLRELACLPEEEFLTALESQTLERLEVPGLEPADMDVLRRGRLPALRSLRMHGASRSGHVRAVFSAPLPFPLRELELTGCWLQTEDVQGLCEWGGLADLEALDLSPSRFGAEGVVALADALAPGRLRRLTMDGCALFSEWVAPLGRVVAAGLTELDLTHNSIEARSLRWLLGDSGRANLRSLRLARNPLGDEGAAALAEWPGLASLKVLDLSSTRLTEAGLGALCTSPHLGELEELHLSDNKLTDGLTHLAWNPKMRRLRTLRATSCSLGDRRVAPLLESPHLESLGVIDLTGNLVRFPMKKRLRPRFPFITFDRPS